MTLRPGEQDPLDQVIFYLTHPATIKTCRISFALETSLSVQVFLSCMTLFFNYKTT